MEQQENILRHSFYQFLFFRQWHKLRAYANERGIGIIGDIPIFIAYDSADAWANPELFYLDEESQPTVVAGVPPDYFSPTGQLWGNPLYRWNVLKKTGVAGPASSTRSRAQPAAIAAAAIRAAAKTAGQKALIHEDT